MNNLVDFRSEDNDGVIGKPQAVLKHRISVGSEPVTKLPLR